MTNRWLRQLGFSAEDRVVIVNADDVGMCGATVDAFFEMADSGVISSGSVMVPCPWFPEVAAACRRQPDIDMGVHLTLTSEWDGYRWGPLVTRDPTSGLVDAEGYFYRSQDMWPFVDPDAIGIEMGAQLDRAAAAGIDVTHADSHMFSILHPQLAGPYVGAGLVRRIPVLMTRQPQWVAALSEASIAGWEAQGVPVVDNLREMPLDGPVAHRLDVTMRLFAELPAGLTYLITHPAKDTPELRAITSDWRHRVADFVTFGDPGLGRQLRELGVHVIGWRPFREQIRTEVGSRAAGDT